MSSIHISRYTYEMMIEDAGRHSPPCMATTLMSVIIGHSVEGRDLTLIKMGTGDRKLLLVGAHHAREYISSTYLNEHD